MSSPKQLHQQFVDDWVKRSVAGLPLEAVLDSFDVVLNAIWRRSYSTLGEVTLVAITDRVLFSSGKTYPWLAQIRQKSEGLSLSYVMTQPETVGESELIAGLRTLLVEFLTILATLSADTITPILYQEILNQTHVPVRLPSILPAHADDPSTTQGGKNK